jgi:hypothetical protein
MWEARVAVKLAENGTDCLGTKCYAAELSVRKFTNQSSRPQATANRLAPNRADANCAATPHVHHDRIRGRSAQFAGTRTEPMDCQVARNAPKQNGADAAPSGPIPCGDGSHGRNTGFAETRIYPMNPEAARNPPKPHGADAALSRPIPCGDGSHGQNSGFAKTRIYPVNPEATQNLRDPNGTDAGRVGSAPLPLQRGGSSGETDRPGRAGRGTAPTICCQMCNRA